LALGLLGAGCGYVDVYVKDVPERTHVSPETTNALMDLINLVEKGPVLGTDFPSDSYNTITTLKTPAGLRLRSRYEFLGISLVEALKTSRDGGVMVRLFDFAEWSNTQGIRSYSLVTLGGFSDPKDKRYFERALMEQDVAIRFAVIEALQLWGREGAVDLLKKAMNDPWSRLLQIFAAQAVLSLGDPAGLDVLHEGLKDNSWIVRAMSARYLGDYAPPEDYEKLLGRLKTEIRNSFVSAELALATLKLFSQADKPIAYNPFKPGWRDQQQVTYTVGKDDVVEVEPLVVIPPRAFIAEDQRVEETINERLLFLIRNKLDEQMSERDKQDPVFEDLLKMTTPAGLALQIRYSFLGLPLIEGLAGSKDPILRAELFRLAQSGSNELIQASAMVALAYEMEEKDLFVIQDALNSEDPFMRFGGMEAVMVGRLEGLMPQIRNIANSDPLPAFRVFAMQLLAQFGDPSGRVLLQLAIDNGDWTARSMATYYMGRVGMDRDQALIRSRLNTEKNPFVQSELVTSISRLAPL
jgi:HEAT repeat protein